MDSLDKQNIAPPPTFSLRPSVLRERPDTILTMLYIVAQKPVNQPRMLDSILSHIVSQPNSATALTSNFTLVLTSPESNTRPRVKNDTILGLMTSIKRIERDSVSPDGIRFVDQQQDFALGPLFNRFTRSHVIIKINSDHNVPTSISLMGCSLASTPLLSTSTSSASMTLPTLMSTADKQFRESAPEFVEAMGVERDLNTQSLGCVAAKVETHVEKNKPTLTVMTSFGASNSNNTVEACSAQKKAITSHLVLLSASCKVAGLAHGSVRDLLKAEEENKNLRKKAFSLLTLAAVLSKADLETLAGLETAAVVSEAAAVSEAEEALDSVNKN